MMSEEISYKQLEGIKLSESDKRELGLKEIGWSKDRIICKNGDYIVHLDRETNEVVKTCEKTKPDLNRYEGNGFHKPGSSECPSNGSNRNEELTLSNYNHKKYY